MARPSVQHSGFLIPNAQDVSNTVLAEPDKIDFNTIADARWGVVSGCALGEQGPLALTIGGGVAVVNGQIVPVRGGTVTLTQPTTGSRFINIVVDDGGVVRTIDGSAAADPVFPDVPVTNTLLATVHATSNAVSLQDFVVDKRKFLTPALLANVAPTADLVLNYNTPNPPEGEPSQWFRINGQGDVNWAGEITLKRKDKDALTLDKRLEAGSLTAQDNVVSTSGNLQAFNGLVTARNLRSAANPPVNPGLADFWQDTTNGIAYIGTRIGVESGQIDWQPLATADTALPVGTIIDSVETKAIMRDKGWLPLDGTLVSEDDFPNLFKLTALVPAWVSGGTAPHRTMTLPNLERRFRITDSDDTAKISGSNTKYISRQHLPPHGHNVRVDAHGDISPTAQLTGMSGPHSHPINGDGEHDHEVYDKGHKHGNNFVAPADWGGSMLDGLINDRSHTWKVDVWAQTATSYAQIVAKPAKIGGLAIPPNSGYHSHTVQVSKLVGLTHTVRQDSVGEGAAFDVTPAYFTVRTYIRT